MKHDVSHLLSTLTLLVAACIISSRGGVKAYVPNCNLGGCQATTIRRTAVRTAPYSCDLHYRPRQSSLFMTNNNDNEDSSPSEDDDAVSGGKVDEKDEAVTTEITTEEISRIQKFRRRLFPPKEDDGLTFRQKLAKLGLSVALSYGWVSNVSYSVTVSLAWYIFSKRTGLSPLAPDQWKGFLAVYAGFYVFNNIVRPIRLAVSVSISIYFDRVVAFIQDKFRVKKGVAIGLTVFFANVVGTIALMCLGISIAATAAGVPVFSK